MKKLYLFILISLLLCAGCSYAMQNVFNRGIGFNKGEQFVSVDETFNSSDSFTAPCSAIYTFEIKAGGGGGTGGYRVYYSYPDPEYTSWGGGGGEEGGREIEEVYVTRGTELTITVGGGGSGGSHGQLTPVYLESAHADNGSASSVAVDGGSTYTANGGDGGGAGNTGGSGCSCTYDGANGGTGQAGDGSTHGGAGGAGGGTGGGAGGAASLSTTNGTVGTANTGGGGGGGGGAGSSTPGAGASGGSGFVKITN